MNEVVTRFAPSPTGYLHIGSIRTALVNYIVTEQSKLNHSKSKFFLRIENTDKARSNNKFKESILNGLQWLGIKWDGDISIGNTDWTVVSLGSSGTTVSGVDIAYNNYYFVDGGISKLFLIYSWEESSNLSFGIEYSSLFGNQFIDDRLNTYEVEIDTISSGTVISEIVDGDNIYFVHPINGEMINVIKTHKYTGSELILEGRYTTLYHEGVVRLGVNGPIQVQSKDNFNGDSNYLSDAIISELSFGYHYKKSDNSGIIFETHVIPPFNLPHAVALFNIMPPRKNSIHLGTYYQITNPKFGFWNNINLMGGVYLKRLDFSKNEYFDYGFTLGLGLEYIANTQIFDIALRVGERESYILQGQYEHYTSIHFGITTGEKWFIKRRK